MSLFLHYSRYVSLHAKYIVVIPLKEYVRIDKQKDDSCENIVEATCHSQGRVTYVRVDRKPSRQEVSSVTAMLELSWQCLDFPDFCQD